MRRQHIPTVVAVLLALPLLLSCAVPEGVTPEVTQPTPSPSPVQEAAGTPTPEAAETPLEAATPTPQTAAMP